VGNFSKNAEAIEEDFALITKNRSLQKQALQIF